jgi:glutathione synthase/RimK-type ligase-like ATP-grasp enzyme
MSAPWRTSLVIGNPENRRVPMWQAAVRNTGRPESVVVSYAELLQGVVDLRPLLRQADVIRLESPGESTDVERLLILRGAARAGRDDVCPQRLAAALADHGRIVHPGLWADGYRDVLSELALLRVGDDREGQAPDEPQSVNGLNLSPGSAGAATSHADTSCVNRWLSDPGEVRVMFDKPECQRRLESAGVAVPRAFAPVGGYEQLREVMREAGCSRVFVKSPGGSSASGVVALHAGSSRISAVTSVEIATDADGVRLYNSLRVRRYEDEHLIAALIDGLAADGSLHVEEWVPKAGFAGRTFDLRIVVIGGEPQHVVMRTSRVPLTNLHLGNRRGDLAALRRAVPEARWDAALESCRRVAELFPGCLMLGIDLGLTPGFRKHFVVEVNAFGDLLPGVLHEGRDTYEAQVATIG